MEPNPVNCLCVYSFLEASAVIIGGDYSACCLSASSAAGTSDCFTAVINMNKTSCIT